MALKSGFPPPELSRRRNRQRRVGSSRYRNSCHELAAFVHRLQLLDLRLTRPNSIFVLEALAGEEQVRLRGRARRLGLLPNVLLRVPDAGRVLLVGEPLLLLVLDRLKPLDAPRLVAGDFGDGSRAGLEELGTRDAELEQGVVLLRAGAKSLIA